MPLFNECLHNMLLHLLYSQSEYSIGGGGAYAAIYWVFALYAITPAVFAKRIQQSAAVAHMPPPIWRRIEVVITGRTRNAFGGQPPRGFESHRLR